MVSTIKKGNINNKRHSKLKRKVYKYQLGGAGTGVETTLAPAANDTQNLYQKIYKSVKENVETINKNIFTKLSEQISDPYKKKKLEGDQDKIILYLLIEILRVYTITQQKMCAKNQKGGSFLNLLSGAAKVAASGATNVVGGVGSVVGGVGSVVGGVANTLQNPSSYFTQRSLLELQGDLVMLIIADQILMNKMIKEELIDRKDALKDLFALNDINDACDSINNLTIRAVLMHQIKDKTKEIEENEKLNTQQN